MSWHKAAKTEVNTECRRNSTAPRSKHHPSLRSYLTCFRQACLTTTTRQIREIWPSIPTLNKTISLTSKIRVIQNNCPRSKEAMLSRMQLWIRVLICINQARRQLTIYIKLRRNPVWICTDPTTPTTTKASRFIKISHLVPLRPFSKTAAREIKAGLWARKCYPLWAKSRSKSREEILILQLQNYTADIDNGSYKISWNKKDVYLIIYTFLND